MHTIILDASSPFQVRIPTTEQWSELIDLGQSVIAYDQSLPPEQQSPYTPLLAHLLERCVPHFETYKSSEVERTIASEAVKRLDEQVTELIRQIHQIVKGFLYKTPEQAEAWGFEVKQTTRSILLPKTRKQRLTMLKQYIAKEESRPAEERFTVPDLTTVKQTRDALVTSMADRRSARNRRKSSRVARDEAFSQLVDSLRMAAGHLMLVHFNHKISLEMQSWGFEIVERQNGHSERSQQQPVEADEPEAAANGNGSLNGAHETVLDLDSQA